MTLVGILAFYAAHLYDKRQRAKVAAEVDENVVVEEEAVAKY